MGLLYLVPVLFLGSASRIALGIEGSALVNLWPEQWISLLSQPGGVPDTALCFTFEEVSVQR